MLDHNLDSWRQAVTVHEPQKVGILVQYSRHAKAFAHLAINQILPLPGACLKLPLRVGDRIAMGIDHRMPQYLVDPLEHSIGNGVLQLFGVLVDRGPVEVQHLDKLYGVQGFAKAKLSEFAAVAEVAGRYGFVKKPKLFSNGGRVASTPPAMRQVDRKLARAPVAIPALAQPVNTLCPFSGDPVDPTVTLSHGGKVYGFCCTKCVAAFKRDPQAAIARLEKNP